MKKKSFGFTLIELLAVIAILAVVFALIVPNVTRALLKSNQKSYESQVNLIIKSAKSYVTEHRRELPLLVSGDFVILYLKTNETLSNGLSLGLSNNDYIKENIRDPLYGKYNLIKEGYFPDNFEVIVWLDEFENVQYDYYNPNGPFKFDVSPVRVYIDKNTLYDEEDVMRGVTASFEGTDLKNDITYVINDGSASVPLNTSSKSIYIIKYSLTYEDKTYYKYRYVYVGNFKPPEITIGKNVVLDVMDVFTDTYSAKDYLETDITNRVIVKYYNSKGNEVSKDRVTKEAGIYRATYNVADNDDNYAEEKVREIHVRPVITAKDVVFHEVDTPFIAPTATARYSEFGYETITGVNLGVNTNISGDTFSIKYDYKYNGVNAETKYTKVNIFDSLTPSIVLNDDTVFMEVMGTYDDTAYSIYDAVDEDIASKVTIKYYNSSNTEVSKRDMETLAGIYRVVYSATNSLGNTREVTATVYVRPVIIVGATIYHDVKTPFTAPTATARYSETGYETLNATSNVNVNLLGTYSLTFDYEYASVRAYTKIQSVVVRDTTPPVITVKQSSYNIKTTDTITLANLVTVTDNYDSGASLLANLKITSSPTFDIKTPGTYTVYYNLKDSSGNSAEEKSITITVKKGTILDQLLDAELGPCSCFGY